MNEIWKPVTGYEGYYEVSNLGRIRSLERYVATSYGRMRLLRQSHIKGGVDAGGYSKVCLSRSGRTITARVHRIVMMAFSPNANYRNLDVNHIDGDKRNNHTENLEWCTRGENHKHRYRVLRQKHSFVGRTGAMHARSKPVVGVNVRTGETVAFESANQAAIKMSMCFSKICACARGNRATHGGFEWMWA